MIIQSAAVLEAVKARPGNAGVRLYGGATADLDSLCARRRPKSRSGRKKACGAVEQKKAPKQERKRRRVERALTTSRSYKVFGRRNDGSLHALRGPAAEKRQGRKSRVGSGGGAATMGISPRAQASMWWNVAATWAILPRGLCVN